MIEEGNGRHVNVGWRDWQPGAERDYRPSPKHPPSRPTCEACGRPLADAWAESRHRIGKHNYDSWTMADRRRQEAAIGDRVERRQA